jgi:hypothetical protein
VSVAPALVVVLTLAFGNRPGLAAYTSPLQATYTSHPEDLRPRMDPALASLLDGLGIKRSDAITYYDTNLLPVWPVADGERADGLDATHVWLPTHPFALMMFLPPDRRELHFSRFVARERAGGWLIEPKGVDIRETLGGGEWFYDELRRTHTSTASFENERWRVSWFTPGGDGRKITSGGGGRYPLAAGTRLGDIPIHEALRDDRDRPSSQGR